MAQSIPAFCETGTLPGKAAPEVFDLSDGEDGDTLSTVDTVGQVEDQSDLADGGRSGSPHSIRYLQLYGYIADDLQTWSATADMGDLPVARFKVRIHTELHGHTLYLIECALSRPNSPRGITHPDVTWSTTKRLSHLRKDLHDCLKAKLGDDYGKYFAATPFAHRLGPPGTTARLNAWFETLSTCMSATGLSPALVAQVLFTLEAPTISSGMLLNACRR